MTVYRDSAGNLIEAPDTTVTYESSTGAPMDGLPGTSDPYRNAAGQLMAGDPDFPRGGVGAWLATKTALAAYLDTTDGAANPRTRGVMASPPTVTTSTSDLSATYATTLTMATPADFEQCRLDGGAYTLEGLDLRPAQATRALGVEQKNMSRLSFNVVDASAIAFYVIGTTLPYRFLLDDQYVDMTGTVPAATTGTGNNWIILTPGSNFTGKVSIELQQNCKLRRIGLPAGASYGAKPAALTTFRGIVLGDSFTEGGNAAHYNDAFVPVLADYLGVPDIWASGIGSTGYVNTSSGTRYKLSERIEADLDRALTYGPLHLVAVAMGYNDLALSGVQAEAETCFDIIRQKCPAALVTILGPWDRNAPGAVAAGYDTTKAAIQAAIGSRGGFYFIDMQSDAYTKAADTVHPNATGHDDLRVAIEADIRALVAA